MNQFDSYSCQTLFFVLSVDVYGNQFVTDSDKKSVKNGGLVIFLGDFSGLLIPQASGNFGLVSTPGFISIVYNITSSTHEYIYLYI